MGTLGYAHVGVWVPFNDGAAAGCVANAAGTTATAWSQPRVQPPEPGTGTAIAAAHATPTTPATTSQSPRATRPTPLRPPCPPDLPRPPLSTRTATVTSTRSSYVRWELAETRGCERVSAPARVPRTHGAGARVARSVCSRSVRRQRYMGPRAGGGLWMGQAKSARQVCPPALLCTHQDTRTPAAHRHTGAPAAHRYIGRPADRYTSTPDQRPTSTLAQRTCDRTRRMVPVGRCTRAVAGARPAPSKGQQRGGESRPT